MFRLISLCCCLGRCVPSGAGSDNAHARQQGLAKSLCVPRSRVFFSVWLHRKTTLLNVVAGYGNGGVTTGRITVNGEEISGEHMRELSSFVHQHDVIMPSMTVREAVTMAAFLRLPASTSAEVKRARVEEVMRWLSLTKVADNQIGSPLKKGIRSGSMQKQGRERPAA